MPNKTESPACQNNFCYLLTKHVGRENEKGARGPRESTGIHDTQARNAVDTEIGVEDSVPVSLGTNSTGSRDVMAKGILTNEVLVILSNRAAAVGLDPTRARGPGGVEGSNRQLDAVEDTASPADEFLDGGYVLVSIFVGEESEVDLGWHRQVS